MYKSDHGTTTWVTEAIYVTYNHMDECIYVVVILHWLLANILPT